MKKKVIAVDIDETLCTNVTTITKISDYDNAKPNIEIIALINKLYKKNYIVLYTARGKLITKNKPNLKKKYDPYRRTYVPAWQPRTRSCRPCPTERQACHHAHSERRGCRWSALNVRMVTDQTAPSLSSWHGPPSRWPWRQVT